MAAFVDARAAAFDGLEVLYRQGQKPRLVMLDDAGEVVEAVPIGAWTEDAIVEFLDDTIGRTAAPAADAGAAVAADAGDAGDEL